MSLRNIFLFALLLATGTTGVYAQTVNLSSSASQCKATGNITASISPAPSPGQYTVQVSGTDIYGQPFTAGPTHSLVIPAVPAGSYSVIVTDAAAGFSDTQAVTVAGSYQAPGVLTVQTFTNQTTNCSGVVTGGTVALNQPANGLAPYIYALGNNPNALTWQSSVFFSGLAPGTYSLWTRDNCGDVRTTTVSIGSVVAATNVLNTATAFLTDVPCSLPDSFDFSYQGQTSLSSYNLEIRSGGCSGPVLNTYSLATANFNGYIRRVPAIPGACYLLTGVNACNGNTETRSLTVPTGSFNAVVYGAGLAGCGGNHNYSYATTNMSYPIDIDFYNADFSTYISSLTATGNYGSFYWNQPDGTYKAIFTDACGQVDTATFSLTSALPSFFVHVASKGPVGCEVGKGYAALQPFGIAPFVVNMFTMPAGAAPLLVAGNTDLQYYNLIAGNYAVEVTDACGHKDTANFTILSTDLVNFSSGALDSISRSCGATNAAVYYSITGNFNPVQVTDLRVNLRNLANNGLITDPLSYTWNNNTRQVRFNNVPPGDYQIEFTWGNGTSAGILDCFQPAWDTVRIPSATVPSLVPSEAFTCQQGTDGIVIANATGGYPPYQYQMRPMGNSTWSALQTSNMFVISSAMVGTVYELQAVDKCGNTSVYQVTMLSGPVPRVLNALPDTVCIGDPASINLVNPIPGATYQWSNSAGTILSFTQPSLSFASVSAVNDDTYTLTTSISGCVTLVAQQALEVINCNVVLPITLSSFTAALAGAAVQLAWTVQAETGLDHYEIERSTDGKTFVSVGTVAAQQQVRYAFSDARPYVNALNYYRLHMVSSDGMVVYSPVRTVLVKVKRPDVSTSAYPVPFSSSLQIRVDLTEATHGTIQLSDMAGHVLLARNVELQAGQNILVLDEVRRLPAGIYLLRLEAPAFSCLLKACKY